MKKEKQILIWVLPACLFCIAVFFLINKITRADEPVRECVNVGLILEGDESTPYSSNFIRATDELKLQYGDRVNIEPMYNVAFDDTLDAIDKLCADGCDIIFLNSVEYGEPAKFAAAMYPNVQFCQTACDNANTDPYRPNYHTFMGRIYEGRYVAGRVAGLKLRELIVRQHVRRRIFLHGKDL